jgi:hypothetical protein
MEERRQHPRPETNEPAFISGDGSCISCRIVNMSSEGAAIDVPNASYVPDRFDLMMARDRTIRRCRTVWILGNSGQRRRGILCLRNNRDWTPEDEKKLLEMGATSTSFGVIAKALRRTQSAVEGRARSLRNRIDPSLRNPGPDEEVGGN